MPFGNWLKRLLSPLASAIRDSEETLGRSPAEANPEYLEAIADEERLTRDGLLGAAFVVCQTHVTGTVSTLIGYVVGASIFILPGELAASAGPAVFVARRVSRYSMASLQIWSSQSAFEYIKTSSNMYL